MILREFYDIASDNRPTAAGKVYVPTIDCVGQEGLSRR